MTKELRLQDQGAPEGLGIIVRESRQRATESHSHTFYELVFIKSGFCLHETSRQTELLIEGDCFLLKPGEWHRYIGSYMVELYNCLFNYDELIGLFDGKLLELPGLSVGDPYTKLHLDITEQKRELRIVKGIIYEQEQQEAGWEIKVKSQLCSLLIDYSRTWERTQMLGDRHSAYPNYVTRALELITDQYQETGLTVAGIASKVGVTADYLSRQFKNLCGIGVQEYIRRFRFSKAAELLVQGMSVNDTYKAVGFVNLCHFSREFKRELGVSPTQYAKQNI